MDGAQAAFEVEWSDQGVREVLESITIPPCPAVVHVLLGQARRPEVDVRLLAGTIGADVGIAAAVLQAANAPFFGMRGRATTIAQALAVIGVRNLIKIVYGVMLGQGLGGGRAATLERFWDRSHYLPIAVAALARRLSRVDGDDAYTYGLFHDMGIAVLMQEFVDYRATLAAANAAPGHFTRIEDERHRVNHAMVGAMFAREWLLPPELCWAVFYHHHPQIFERPTEYATDAVLDLIALGRVAEHLVARFLGRPDDPEWALSGVAMLARFGLDADGAEPLGDEVRPMLDEARAYAAP